MPLINLGILLVLIFILITMYYRINSVGAKVKLAVNELKKISDNTMTIRRIEEDRDFEELERTRK